MPLINTTAPANIAAIDEILETSGVKAAKSAGLEKKLKENRLDTDSLLSGIGDIVHNADSDIVRLRAIEMAARMNSETRGALNDNKVSNVPVINIIINDSQSVSINPILIPRECQ